MEYWSRVHSSQPYGLSFIVTTRLGHDTNETAQLRDCSINLFNRVVRVMWEVANHLSRLTFVPIAYTKYINEYPSPRIPCGDVHEMNVELPM